MHSLDQNIHDIFKGAFDQKRNKPFIDFGGRTISYGELKQKVGKYTTYFKEAGIKNGDRIVFSSENEPFVCLFAMALLANGITMVLLDPEGGSNRSNAIIDHCEPHSTFLDEDIARKWHIKHSEDRPLVTVAQTAGNSMLDKLLGKKEGRRKTFPASIDSLPEADIATEIDPDSDAIIMFTSGTTSAPKGVRMSFRALFSHMQSLANVYRFKPDSRLFNNLMLSHTDGMTQGPVLALFSGITLYRPFLFSIQRIEDLFDVVYSESITHWIMVPTMISLIYQFKQNDEDRLDHNGFEYVISCGGMLESKIWQEFENRFQTMIINGYGLTETIAGGLFAGPDDASHIIGTIGKPVDCEARIVDEDGNDLPAGEKGELWMRGSLIMRGYFNAPLLNKEVFSGEWLKTGDLSFKGDDDCYRIVGRKKSAIVSGGFLIIPEEVTEVINTHPGVKESVTFALKDETWGEKVASAVCVNEGTSLAEEEILDYCRQHLEQRKIPTRVYFMDRLPRGRSGKVLLPDIMEYISNAGTDERDDEDTRSSFLQIVAHSLQIPLGKLNDSMIAEETPEWDSIRHLVMVGDLERHFKITFTPVEVMNIKKLSDLSVLVNQKTNIL